MGRDALIVELETRNKRNALYLVFPTDKAIPRRYIVGRRDLVEKELDNWRLK